MSYKDDQDFSDSVLIFVAGVVFAIAFALLVAAAAWVASAFSEHGDEPEFLWPVGAGAGVVLLGAGLLLAGALPFVGESLLGIGAVIFFSTIILADAMTKSGDPGNDVEIDLFSVLDNSWWDDA